MKKRLLGFLLSVLLASICIGCGSENTTTEPTPAPTTEPTPEATAEPTPEPTKAPTPEPTAKPTPEPTAEPTPEPAQETASSNACPYPLWEVTDNGNSMSWYVTQPDPN